MLLLQLMWKHKELYYNNSIAANFIHYPLLFLIVDLSSINISVSFVSYFASWNFASISHKNLKM